MRSAAEPGARAATAASPVRLGFAGLGWIGRRRMQSLLGRRDVVIAALADPDPASLAAARELAPGAAVLAAFDELLDRELDALVIATPSAQHAAQARAALERGFSVFCQKPLGRDAREARSVVGAARAHDRLLEVDLCYRSLRGVPELRARIARGELGEVYAAELVFHNAYGPDKAWFRDRGAAGGGCVLDLGVHLVDLAAWLLGGPTIEVVASRLHAGGERLAPPLEVCEDHAEVVLDLDRGRTVARLATSWNLPLGCDARIEVALHGTRGGARISNVGGSFHDFEVVLLRGTRSERLAGPPDDWGGRTISAWLERVARGERFDPTADDLVRVAEVIDRIYGSCARGGVERARTDERRASAGGAA